MLPTRRSNNTSQSSTPDVLRVFPEALVHKQSKQRPIYFTVRWFWEAAKHVYECFNARETKRRMARWYSSIALHQSVHMHFAGTAPYSFAWQLASLPKNAVIRGVLVKGLATFAHEQAQKLRQLQLLHNGKGLRIDGISS